MHRMGRRTADGSGRIDAGRLRLAVVGVLGFRTGSAAGSAFVATSGAVGLDVLGQVIGAHEALVAHGTGEAFLARVGAQVSLQLVGAREAFAAEEPVADEGPLARVPAQMGLEMRRLAVDLAAAGDVAAVDVALAQVSAGRTQSVGLLTVGAVASGAARVAARRSGRRHLRQRWLRQTERSAH